MYISFNAIYVQIVSYGSFFVDDTLLFNLFLQLWLVTGVCLFYSR